jgi:hypothetical protein
VTIPLGRNPTTGKLFQHHKTISGAKKEAEAYRTWAMSLVAPGATDVKTISQTELKELRALEDVAAKYRTRLVSAIQAGAQIEPGPLKWDAMGKPARP